MGYFLPLWCLPLWFPSCPHAQIQVHLARTLPWAGTPSTGILVQSTQTGTRQVQVLCKYQQSRYIQVRVSGILVPVSGPGGAPLCRQLASYVASRMCLPLPMTSRAALAPHSGGKGRRVTSMPGPSQRIQTIQLRCTVT